MSQHGLLAAWRDAEGISQEKAAERVKVSQGTWAAWERGKKAPDLFNALAIERLTDGKVPAVGWAQKRALPRKRGEPVRDDDSGTLPSVEPAKAS